MPEFEYETYDLERTVHVDHDFVEDSSLVTALLGNPIEKAFADGRKIHITVDYDPTDSKVTVNFYRHPHKILKSPDGSNIYLYEDPVDCKAATKARLASMLKDGKN